MRVKATDKWELSRYTLIPPRTAGQVAPSHIQSKGSMNAAPYFNEISLVTVLDGVRVRVTSQRVGSFK